MYSTPPRNSFYIVLHWECISVKREIKVQVWVLDTTTGDKYVIHVQYSTENITWLNIKGWFHREHQRTVYLGLYLMWTINYIVCLQHIAPKGTEIMYFLNVIKFTI